MLWVLIRTAEAVLTYILWKNMENYLQIIIKYPLYLFFCLTLHLLAYPDPRAFIYDNNPFPVCLVHDLLCVRIVGGPETVHSQPFQHVEIPGYKRVVQTFTSDLEIYTKRW